MSLTPGVFQLRVFSFSSDNPGGGVANANSITHLVFVNDAVSQPHPTKNTARPVSPFSAGKALIPWNTRKPLPISGLTGTSRKGYEPFFHVFGCLISLSRLFQVVDALSPIF